MNRALKSQERSRKPLLMTTEDSSLSTPQPTLSPIERRILGVLVEKALTTPDQYPLTVAALVAGCNQKSNRDPVTEYDADDVSETLETLRRRGVTVRYEAGTGRVDRWRHLLGDWLKVDKPQLAVVVELLLRGPQTVGELRARAARMQPIADLEALEGILQTLRDRKLVFNLTPPEQKRGVVVSHALYPANELERVKQKFARTSAASVDDELDGLETTVHGAGGSNRGTLREEVDLLRGDLRALSDVVERLSSELRALKTALGVEA